MNIVCVHSSLCAALSGLGHNVLDLRPGPGIVRLSPLMGGFVPDLLVQQESLGPRTLLVDLPALSCPKIFWSIDTHQNSFWHVYYARLFDLFCTTQKHWQAWFRERGISGVRWLPWYGASRNLAPWDRRRKGMGFVGRVTPGRPVRTWFLDWLGELGRVEQRDDLNFAAMLDFYDHSRIVPNESIFSEVNFRLFEAASCGCVVINPAVQGIEDLFLPGEEVAVYRDGAELASWVARLGSDDLLTRSMGLRARERVSREHLPEHRAGALLDMAQAIGSGAVRGADAQRAWWLTLYHLWEAGRLDMDRAVLLSGLEALPLSDEILAVMLRLRAVGGREEFMRLAVPVADKEQYAAFVEVNLAGSMGALFFEDVRLSRLFFLRHKRYFAPSAPDPGGTPLLICLAWARELQRLGQVFRPGFVFNPKKHLAASSLECLVQASEHAPENPDVYRAMAGILARESGWDALRLRAMSYLSLRERENWKLTLELGAADCRAFRVRQGLEELLCARDEALRQGQEARFWRRLEAHDQSGRIGDMLKSALASATHAP
jgi:hypothetical protein